MTVGGCSGCWNCWPGASRNWQVSTRVCSQRPSEVGGGNEGLVSFCYCCCWASAWGSSWACLCPCLRLCRCPCICLSVSVSMSMSMTMRATSAGCLLPAASCNAPTWHAHCCSDASFGSFGSLPQLLSWLLQSRLDSTRPGPSSVATRRSLTCRRAAIFNKSDPDRRRDPRPSTTDQLSMATKIQKRHEFYTNSLNDSPLCGAMETRTREGRG